MFLQTYTHDARASIGSILRPMYIGRFLLLLIAVFCNIALAVLGNVYHARHQEKDFATFLLAVLMLNLLLYMFFYIVMKVSCLFTKFSTRKNYFNQLMLLFLFLSFRFVTEKKYYYNRCVILFCHLLFGVLHYIFL